MRVSGATSSWRRIDIEITSSSPSKLMPRTPTEERPAKTRTSPTGKRIALPLRVASSTSSASRAGRDRDQPVVGVLALELHRDLAVGADVDEIAERVAPDIAVARSRTSTVNSAQLSSSSGSGITVEIVSPGAEIRQQIDHRPAARLRRAERQAIDLELVDPARVEVKNSTGAWVEATKTCADEILLAHRHAGAAAAAAALRAIGRERHALDVAGVADRDDHVLALDQRLDIGLELDVLDRRCAAASRTAP